MSSDSREQTMLIAYPRPKTPPPPPKPAASCSNPPPRIRCQVVETRHRANLDCVGADRPPASPRCLAHGNAPGDDDLR